jgi:hypothetical protein
MAICIEMSFETPLETFMKRLGGKIKLLRAYRRGRI